MEYTAIIRTLGKAGDKYQAALDSLAQQTLPKGMGMACDRRCPTNKWGK